MQGFYFVLFCCGLVWFWFFLLSHCPPFKIEILSVLFAFPGNNHIKTEYQILKNVALQEWKSWSFFFFAWDNNLEFLHFILEIQCHKKWLLCYRKERTLLNGCTAAASVAPLPRENTNGGGKKQNSSSLLFFIEMVFLSRRRGIRGTSSPPWPSSFALLHSNQFPLDSISPPIKLQNFQRNNFGLNP